MSGEPIDREYYDRSGYFDRGAGHLTDLGSTFQRYRVAKVLEIYPPGDEERVLDLGCGWGTFEFVLAPRVKEVVGLDFSERSIELCEERLRREPHSNVRFLRADARDTGLDDASFDVVIAADLLEHLYPDDSEQVLAEAHRLLERGGRLVLWTPHRGHFLEKLKNRSILLKPDPTHVDYKSMERLTESLRGQGFTIQKAYYVESHLPVLRTFERNLLSAFPIFRRRIAILAQKR
jgi:ubiquinone/menaquinone biosynthesis C-methylase UbiE